MYTLSNYIPFILIPFMGWGVRRMLIRNKQYTMLKRMTFKIGISAFFLTEMARSFYRPYIYQYNIFDFYIADTIGNSLGTITAIFMILTLTGKEKLSDLKIILILIVGLIAYEGINLTSDNPFDYRDVIATLIFGSLSLIFYLYLLNSHICKKLD